MVNYIILLIVEEFRVLHRIKSIIIKEFVWWKYKAFYISQETWKNGDKHYTIFIKVITVRWLDTCETY